MVTVQDDLQKLGNPGGTQQSEKGNSLMHRYQHYNETKIITNIRCYILILVQNHCPSSAKRKRLISGYSTQNDT